MADFGSDPVARAAAGKLVLECDGIIPLDEVKGIVSTEREDQWEVDPGDENNAKLEEIPGEPKQSV